MAARSCAAAVMAILNLRGRNVNSGCTVQCWRTISAQMRGSSISSGATPAQWSVVTLRTELPLVWMPCSLWRARYVHRVGQFFELDPVELDVLPRGEVPVAAVVAARHVRERAQLLRRQRAVGDADPQHVGVELQIDAIEQAQQLELVLGQLAREPPAHLVAEFRHPLLQERPVVVVVDVHVSLRRRHCNGGKRDGRTADADALAQVSRQHAAIGRDLDRRHIGPDRAHAVRLRGVEECVGIRRRRHDGGRREAGGPAAIRRTEHHGAVAEPVCGHHHWDL